MKGGVVDGFDVNPPGGIGGEVARCRHRRNPPKEALEPNIVNTIRLGYMARHVAGCQSWL